MRTHKERMNSFIEFYNLTAKEANAAINLLDKNLKRGYTLQALEHFGTEKTTRQVIRLVKTGSTRNPEIFNFLLDLAIQKESSAVAAQKEIKEKLTL